MKKKCNIPKICVASSVSCLNPSLFSDVVMMFEGFCFTQTLKSPVISVALVRSIIFMRDDEVSLRLFELDR